MTAQLSTHMCWTVFQNLPSVADSYIYRHLSDIIVSTFRPRSGKLWKTLSFSQSFPQIAEARDSFSLSKRLQERFGGGLRSS